MCGHNSFWIWHNVRIILNHSIFCTHANINGEGVPYIYMTLALLLWFKKGQCKRNHMLTGFDEWYLPVEVLWQPLALQKTSPLSQSHLTSIIVGVEVDGCVIDGRLWDIRLRGWDCHSGWRGGVRWWGRGVRGGEGGAPRNGPGNWVGVWSSWARPQRKWRLWWLRGGSWRESGWCGGNGGYFGGIRGGRSRDHTAARAKRPGCLIVCRIGLTRWLGVCAAWGRVSDWDGLNDFLWLVLDEGGDTQHAHTHTQKPKNQLMHVNRHSQKHHTAISLK